MDEEWRQIVEYPDYSVSDHGRIRNDRSGRIITLQRNRQGNIYVGLYLEGRQRSVGVAKQVMYAFLDNPFEQYGYNIAPIHIDGDLSNNYLTNLAVRSRSYAIDYQLQFPLEIIYWTGPIIELTTGLEFRNSREAMFHFGCIELHILTSLLHERKVPHLELYFRRNL